jgi:hypothetical protein
MAFIIFTIVGFFAVAFLGVAFWQIACWFFRWLLGIPKHPPFVEAEVQQLPYYLDDRIRPPD